METAEDINDNNNNNSDSGPDNSNNNNINNADHPVEENAAHDEVDDDSDNTNNNDNLMDFIDDPAARRKLDLCESSLREFLSTNTDDYTPEEMATKWEDLVFFINYGCVDVSFSNGSNNEGVGMLLPSMIDIHDKPIVLEDVLEVCAKLIAAQQNNHLNRSLFVLTDVETASPIFVREICHSSDHLNEAWITEFRNEPGIQSVLSEFASEDSIFRGSLGPYPHQYHTISIVGPPNAPRKGFIAAESLIQLALRAGCFCLRRDAYDELRRIFVNHVTATVRTCTLDAAEDVGILAGDHRTSPICLTQEKVQRALQQRGIGVAGFGFYGYASLITLACKDVEVYMFADVCYLAFRLHCGFCNHLKFVLNQVHPGLTMSIPALKVMNDCLLTFLNDVMFQLNVKCEARKDSTETNGGRWIYKSKLFGVRTVNIALPVLEEGYTSVWLCTEEQRPAYSDVAGIEWGLFPDAVHSETDIATVLTPRDVGRVAIPHETSRSTRIIHRDWVRSAVCDVLSQHQGSILSQPEGYRSLYHVGAREANKALERYQKHTAPRQRNGLAIWAGLVFLPGKHAYME
jgi:hypothetical protein